VSLRGRWIIVTGLLGLSTVIQVMMVCRAELPERDAIRFAACARQIESQGLLATLRGQHEEPLFLGAAWLARLGLERISGRLPAIGALSVQLPAALALVLSVVPVYYVSVRVYGATAGLIGAVLFCLLPKVCALGAQGMSDSTHLLFLCGAFWMMALWLTGRGGRGATARACSAAGHGVGAPPPERPVASSPAWLGLAGVLTGLAMLARAEALLLPAAFVVSLLMLQASPRWRGPWRRAAVGLGCLGAGMAVVLVPYVWAVGARTPGAAVARILARPDAVAPGELNLVTFSLQVDGDRPLSFDFKESGSIRRRGIAAAVTTLMRDLGIAYGYWAGVLALFGLWVVHKLPGQPVDWFVRTFLVVYCLALLGFAAKEGYLVPRNVAPVVALTVGCAGFGLIELGRRLPAWFSAVSPWGISPGRVARLVTSVLLMVTVGGYLYGVLEPVGDSRGAHRRAGRWLAAQATDAAIVLDTFGWTSLYSGCPTLLWSQAPRTLADPRLAYVVVEPWELHTSSDRSATLRMILETAGEPAAVFPGPMAGGQKRDVAIYRWSPDQFAAAAGRAAARVSPWKNAY